MGVFFVIEREFLASTIWDCSLSYYHFIPGCVWEEQWHWSVLCHRKSFCLFYLALKLFDVTPMKEHKEKTYIYRFTLGCPLYFNWSTERCTAICLQLCQWHYWRGAIHHTPWQKHPLRPHWWIMEKEYIVWSFWYHNGCLWRLCQVIWTCWCISPVQH